MNDIHPLTTFLPQGRKARVRRLIVGLVLGFLSAWGIFSFLTLPAAAAPVGQATLPAILISEFRTRLGSVASDEFIELYNAGNAPVDISGYILKGSNNTGSSIQNKVTIPNGVYLQSGQYYLIANTGFSGALTPDATYSAAIADDGGIALFLPGGTIVVDKVGMSTATQFPFRGGTALPTLGSDGANRSYERLLGNSNGNCQNSSNNAFDFVTRIPSAPQNLTSSPVYCPDALTMTPTETAAVTLTPTQIDTPTNTPTLVETAIPTRTATSTLAPTETATSTQTDIPTSTLTLTETPTLTLVPTTTQTLTSTSTPTPTLTSTLTITSTASPTLTATATPVAPGHVVISEFRTRGPSGANDEFIELFNPTGALVDISGWEIWASNSLGSTGSTPRATIPTLTTLLPGQHYLVVKTTGYSGGVAENWHYSTGITDDGGIELRSLDGITVIDQVGMSVGSAYQEGAPLPTLLADGANRSYERLLGGSSGSCYDTENNSADFVTRIPADPQNLSSAPVYCAGVLTVTPTEIRTPTETAASTSTPTEPLMPTSTRTLASTRTPTNTRTLTSTKTPSSTRTPTNTRTLTSTKTPSSTRTPTNTRTLTSTKTPSSTRTPTSTHTLTSTKTPSSTRTPTNTRTLTPTRIPTKTRTHTPVPGVYVVPSRVILNEFLPYPRSDWNGDGKVDIGDGFIEIKNVGPQSVSLSGWSLDDGVGDSSPYTISAVTIEPGARLVFFESQTQIFLSNLGDSVRLFKSGGTISDAFTYLAAEIPDQSWCRLPDGANDSWRFGCQPTVQVSNQLAQSTFVNDQVQTTLCLSKTTLFVLFQAECAVSGLEIWSPLYWSGELQSEYPLYIQRDEQIYIIE